jgi:ribosomal protein S18 acetylase RimI-like enzyme
MPLSFIELYYLVVDSKHQGKGLGSELLRKLKIKAQANGVRYIVTYADNN